jgi:hypothetical protein
MHAARRSTFVSIKLDRDFLRKSCIRILVSWINGSNKVEVQIEVETIDQFFVRHSFPHNELDFDILVRLGVPKFSFILGLI